MTQDTTLYDIVSRVDNVCNFVLLFAAVVLTAVFWRRLGPASLSLALLAALLLSLAPIVSVLYVWNIDVWTDLDYDTASALSMVSLISTTLGITLLFLALFLARGRRPAPAASQSPGAAHPGAPTGYPGAPSASYLGAAEPGPAWAPAAGPAAWSAPQSAPPAPYPGAPTPYPAPGAQHPGAPAPFSAPPASAPPAAYPGSPAPGQPFTAPPQ
jgi:hypothetical protein